MPFASVSPPQPPRAGRPDGGGGQAKVLSADEIGRVEKCMAGDLLTLLGDDQDITRSIIC